MDHPDARFRASFYAVYCGVCKILSSSGELTAYNFDVGAVARASQVSRSTITRCMKYAQKAGAEGSVTPWLLLRYYDMDIMEEFQRRRTIQEKRGLNTPADYFYALACLIKTNAIYVSACLSQRRERCWVISQILVGAAGSLWRDYYKSAARADINPDKRLFLQKYRIYCRPLLEIIISEWHSIYHLNPAYCDFYAKKLEQTAMIWANGEKEPDQLMRILDEKPNVRSSFLLDDDEWEVLNGRWRGGGFLL